MTENNISFEDDPFAYADKYGKQVDLDKIADEPAAVQEPKNIEENLSKKQLKKLLKNYRKDNRDIREQLKKLKNRKGELIKIIKDIKKKIKESE